MEWSWILKQTKGLSPNSTYQVLIGHRTATTLFFAYRHHLEALYRLFPDMEKEEWFKRQAQDLSSTEENSSSIWPLLLQYHNGMINAYRLAQRRESVALLIQTLSYLKAQDSRFLPLSSRLNVQFAVKAFSVSEHLSPQALSRIIGEEIKQLAKDWAKEDLEAVNLIFSTFEGKEVSAKTIVELSQEWNCSVSEMKAVVNGLYEEFLVRSLAFPHLKRWAKGLNLLFPLWGESVEKTALELKKGKSLQEIAKERHLKMSTISDHILEMLILNPDGILPTFEALAKTYQIPLQEKAPKDYSSFQEKFPEAPFLCFRGWQILEIRRERKKNGLV